MLKNLYFWVLDQAKNPYAKWILFGLAFIESSVFPIPPDVLLIAMVLSHRKQWFSCFLICLIGSVLGGIFGYFLGSGFWHIVGPWFLNHVFSEELFSNVQNLYKQYDFWIVFTAGFTPIPYKVFTITAGVAQVNIITFIMASIFGRGGRFIIVAFLINYFGEPIKVFIEKYFNLLTIVFMIMLVAGIWALKFAAH
jgi:membrane protein YqaA with SNARE-associated domain